MRLDEAGHDGAAARVNAPRLGWHGRRADGRAGVVDAAIFDDQRRVRHGRCAGAVEELTVGNDRGAGGCFHADVEREWPL